MNTGNIATVLLATRQGSGDDLKGGIGEGASAVDFTGQGRETDNADSVGILLVSELALGSTRVFYHTVTVEKTCIVRIECIISPLADHREGGVEIQATIHTRFDTEPLRIDIRTIIIISRKISRIIDNHTELAEVGKLISSACEIGKRLVPVIDPIGNAPTACIKTIGETEITERQETRDLITGSTCWKRVLAAIFIRIRTRQPPVAGGVGNEGLFGAFEAGLVFAVVGAADDVREDAGDDGDEDADNDKDDGELNEGEAPLAPLTPPHAPSCDAAECRAARGYRTARGRATIRRKPLHCNGPYGSINQ